LKLALPPCSTLTANDVSLTTLVSAVVSSAAGAVMRAVAKAATTAISDTSGQRK